MEYIYIQFHKIDCPLHSNSLRQLNFKNLNQGNKKKIIACLLLVVVDVRGGDCLRNHHSNTFYSNIKHEPILSPD